MENAWYATDRQAAGIATATKVAETGSRNVITNIYAGYSSTAQTGTITVTIGAVAVAVIDITGQANLQGLEIVGGCKRGYRCRAFGRRRWRGRQFTPKRIHKVGER